LGPPYQHVLENNLWGLAEWDFSEDGYPTCHPIISVKVLKETQSTNPNQWPGLILSLFTTRLLTEGALLPKGWLFDARTI